MNEDKELNFVFSTDFQQINNKRFHDWCIHMICLDGEGSFVFNNRCYHVRRNDVIILVLPDQVCNLAPNSEFQVKFFAAPLKFLNNLLPSNNFGIGGGISLYNDPVIPLSEKDAKRFQDDIHRLHERIHEINHHFYNELMGSFCQTMMYDLFDFHAKYYGTLKSTNRRSYIVKELIQILSTGCSCTERSVSYYAKRLHITPKYLSDTVRRTTGNSVTFFIDRYTIPIVKKFLNDEGLSLTQISDRMNFTSLSYFSRYVNKHLGMSPSQYRQSYQPNTRKDCKSKSTTGLREF